MVASGAFLACTAEESEESERLLQLRKAQVLSLNVRVATSADDVEESSTGQVSRNSSDLELVRDGSSGLQTVGVRFRNINIPPGATIVAAHLEFVVDEADTTSTALTIRAQDADDAAVFGSSRNNVSNRSLTNASTSWAPSAWTSVGQSQESPDLSALVQEVVDRGGWLAGNNMAFVITGSGERTAESYDGTPASAPLLHIEYETVASAPFCGDAVCDAEEDCSSCQEDCGACSSGGASSGGATNGGASGGGASSGGASSGGATACQGLACGEPTEQDLLVAFIGDQGNNGNSTTVLQLIAAEGADAVVHNGDFDYQDNPSAWDNRITSVLGESYPYFSIVGNHDAAAWSGANGYAAKIAARHTRNPEMECTGELGVRASCNFRGLHMIQSCVGTNELRSSCGANSSDQVSYIQNTLAASTAIFKVCNWHKNQNDMQVGSKGNEVGWLPYQACMNGGAMVSTGHEHSYSRTLTLTDVGNASAGHGARGPYDLVTLTAGQNFAFVSGIAGQALRAFNTSHNNDTWWASYYTSDRWYKNGVTMNGGSDHGALFVRFYVDGDPALARAYFKDVNGRLVDEFDIRVQ